MMYIAEYDSKQVVITVWGYLIPLVLGSQCREVLLLCVRKQGTKNVDKVILKDVLP